MTPWILMYHSVAPYRQDPYRITVDPVRFRAQLSWLRRAGLRGVGVGELLAAQRNGSSTRGLVGLTFDDGYRDFLQHALPALQEYGFGATVFAVAGLLGRYNRWDPDGERKPLLSADELRTVAASGIEIGAHGVGHVPLVGDTDRADEAGGSRRLLEEIVHTPVTGFCYPYGAHDDAALAAVRDAGYAYACATGSDTLGGPHALPRTYVGDQDGPLRLAAKRVRHRMRDQQPELVA